MQEKQRFYMVKKKKKKKESHVSLTLCFFVFFFFLALKLGEVVTTAPTVGFNVEEVTVGGLMMSVWDLGGQTKLRELWKHYYDGTVAIVFVVDSADRQRLADESRVELQRLCQEPLLRSWPLLVLANKQDLPHAATPEEVEQLLGLKQLLVASQNKAAGGNNNNLGLKSYHVQSCCAVEKEGIKEGFVWLAEALKKR